MDTNEIITWIDANVPEVILLLGGLISLAIVSSYIKDKDSAKYKFMTLLGFIFGAIMVFVAYTRHGEWRSATVIFVSVAAFALLIRPLREVHFSVILALLVMGVIYTMLGDLTGSIMGYDLAELSQGYPRIIAAFIGGAIVYMLLHFAEAIVMTVGKILNWWPILLILGLVCIAEAACMFMGYGSIMDYIDTSALSGSS